MRKRWRTIACISGFIIIWLCAGIAYSQSSENYTIEWSVLDEGGGERDSETYHVSHSIGQSSGGLTSSNSRYTNRSGIYAGKTQMMPRPPFPQPEPPTPAVPEPTTFLLLVIGVLGLWLLRRKKPAALKRFLAGCLLIMLLGMNHIASAYVIEFIDSGQSMGTAQSNGIALGDLDSDGDLDAFIANWGGNTVWKYDPTEYKFTDSLQSLGNANSSDVALGDVDGDGDLDAFVINDGAPNTVWLNNGVGQFTDSGQSLGNANSFSIALADIDNDDDLDAFVGNDGPNTVWLNNGSGVFTDSGQNLGTDNSNGVELADLDNDGDLDAFVANSGTANSVWKNNGSGSFSDSGQAMGIENSTDVELGDLDGDGDLDAFISNFFLKANTVWLNDGTGTFTKTSQNLGLAHSYGVALGDVDKDGDLDAFVANFGDDVLWVNDGTGTFHNLGHQLGSTNGREVFLEDIDNDGDLDAFIVNFAQGNTVWYNYGELILTIRPDDLPNDLISFFNANYIQYRPLFDLTRGDQALKKTLGISRTYLLMPTASTDIQALRQLLNARADVETCIYNEALYFDEYMPQDFYLYDELDEILWNLRAIHLPEYWRRLDAPPESSEVALAVIDTPIDLQHRDLAIHAGRNCMNAVCETIDGKKSCACESLDSQPAPTVPHGTLVAGVIGATHDNIEGIAGVAGKYPILAISAGAEVFAKFDAIFGAIEYATDEKVAGNYAAVAINLSASAQFIDAATINVLHSWIQYAYQKGVPVITSMGNNGDGVSRFPAAFPETIAVGATDAQNARWLEYTGETITAGSNSGPHIDLVAPGVNILSTASTGMGKEFVIDPDYDYTKGTSMAAPHVTGVTGLLLDAVLSNTPDQEISANAIEQIRWILHSTAQDQIGDPSEDTPGHDQFYGAGFLNANQALTDAAEEQYLKIEPLFHDFGTVPVMQTVPQTFLITNTCEQPISLDLDGIHITPLDSDLHNQEPSHFTILQPGSGTEWIPSGQSMPINVGFAPLTSGVKQATLQIPLSSFSCTNNQSTFIGIKIPLRGEAVEAEQPMTLTVRKTGSGNGTVALNGLKIEPEPYTMTCKPGSQIILTAHADDDSIFGGWSGIEESAETEYIVTMDTDKTIIAAFEQAIPPTYTLTLSKEGDGQGTLLVNGNECGETCSHTCTAGEQVTLTAETGADARFTGWTAPECGQASECSVTIEADRTIIATFEPIPKYALYISKAGAGSGLVAGSGISCGDACEQTYYDGAEVRLAATADPGSIFVGWSETQCGAQPDCVLAMDAEKTVIATFEPEALPMYTLNVSKSGEGNGVLTVNGSECRAECLSTVEQGTEVRLSAVPDEHSVFAGWSGTPCGNQSECVVTLDENLTITAEFIPKQYELTITKAGAGTGVVKSDTAGITCGVDCAEMYAAGSSITLMAVADEHSVFTGWSAAECGLSAECVIAMDKQRAVIATFEPVPKKYTLHVIKEGEGSGVVQGDGILCGNECIQTYNAGTEIRLSAIADSDSDFSGWSGACQGIGDCIVAMEAAKTVTATFLPRKYTLEIIKIGTGSGSVDGEGISCRETCKKTYFVGSSITLTAEADSDSVFDSWSIAECGSRSACSTTLEKDMTITVTFHLSTSPSPKPSPVSPVPEPGTLALVIAGLFGLLVFGKYGWKNKK